VAAFGRRSHRATVARPVGGVAARLENAAAAWADRDRRSWSNDRVNTPHRETPSPPPRWIALQSLVLLLMSLPAQAKLGSHPGEIPVTRWLAEPVAIDKPVLRLVGLHAPGPALFDDAAWLGDLQRRFGSEGLQVFVALDRVPEGERLPGKESGFGLGIDATGAMGRRLRGGVDAAPRLYLLDAGGRLLWAGDAAHDLTGAIQRALAGELEVHDEQLALLLRQSADDFEDTFADASIVDGWVTRHPRDGLARGIQFLHRLFHRADLEAARRVADAALADLVDSPAALVKFCDIAMRADRGDAELDKSIAMALSPVATPNPEAARTQLVYLRALLRSGREREAGRVAARLPKLLAGRGRELLEFAEVLAEAPDPAVFRDAAERALAAAERLPAPPRWLFGARHKVALRCAGDATAAAAIAVRYRETDDSGYCGDLNNDAWYTVLRLDTLGRFDSLALALAEELQRAEGTAMDSAHQDTVAQVLFSNGRLQEAVELQTAAAAASGQFAYQMRLQRFQKTLERQQKTAAAKQPR
jgi:hypothetical protein